MNELDERYTTSEQAIIDSFFILSSEKEFEKIAVVGGYSGEKIENMLIPCMVCVQYMLDFVDDIKVVCYIDGKIEEMHLTDPRLLSLNINRKVKMKKFQKKKDI